MTTSKNVDLVIIGSGPAGMAAARRAVKGGLSVAVLDSQRQPGGQIWRNALRNASSPILDVLGKEYKRGLKQVKAFLECGADYIPEAQVSRIEKGWSVEYVKDDAIHFVQGENLLLATGAQERPMPFGGWTLPGVMTVGAAQILLKSSGQLPRGPVLVAGNGPLPLLYLQQMKLAGATPLAYLDTTPRGLTGRAMRNAMGAMVNPGQILKGLAWLPAVNRIPHVKNVVRMTAKGTTSLEAVVFETANGKIREMEAKTLLVHEGLVPNHQLAVAAGAHLVWDKEQLSFRLDRDKWMKAEPQGLYLAGDNARIGGAANAEIEGEIAAIGVLIAKQALTLSQANQAAFKLHNQHARQKSFRSFLDGIYPPNIAHSKPDDTTILCRCEEVNAGDLRDIAEQTGCKGPNQLKTFTRAGMGPCQGRQCGYPVHELIKSVGGLPADEVGLYHPRPPFVPVTVAMMAAAESNQINESDDH